MYLLVGVVSVAIGPGGAVNRLNVFSIHLICRECDHVRCGVDSTVTFIYDQGNYLLEPLKCDILSSINTT